MNPPVAIFFVFLRIIVAWLGMSGGFVGLAVVSNRCEPTFFACLMTVMLQGILTRISARVISFTRLPQPLEVIVARHMLTTSAYSRELNDSAIPSASTCDRREVADIVHSESRHEVGPFESKIRVLGGVGVGAMNAAVEVEWLHCLARASTMWVSLPARCLGGGDEPAKADVILPAGNVA